VVFEPLDGVSHIIHRSRVGCMVCDTFVRCSRCVTKLGEVDAEVIVFDAPAVDPTAAVKRFSLSS
jgi:hypothetical protein